MIQLLRKCPALFNLIAAIYYNLNPYLIAEWFIGTKAREREWAGRHKDSDWGSQPFKKEDWVYGYWDSRDHPHRQHLVDTIATFSPSSVLEIGCNCAPNLYLITQRFPEVKACGIDINPLAIQKGNQLFFYNNIPNVQLSIGKADELSQFKDNEFDVVFSDAVLIYIGRDKIYRVISEMLRVAKRGLVLVEQYTPKSKLGIRHHGLWQRDYIQLFDELTLGVIINIQPITRDMWDDPEWSKSGTIIKVVKV